MAKKSARKRRPTKTKRPPARPATTRTRRRPRSPPAAAGAPVWQPGAYAVWSQRWRNLKDETVLLRHPTAPFVETADAISTDTMKKVAYEYLVAANDPSIVDPPLGLPQELLDALKPNSPQQTFFPPWDWLPIVWPPPDPQNVASLASFEADRDDDRIVIMLASQWIVLPLIGKTYLGSGLGIRVVAHARKLPGAVRDGQSFEIRVTGMSACLPADFSLPVRWVAQLSNSRRAASLLQRLFSRASMQAAAETLGFASDSITRGARLSTVPREPDKLQVTYGATGKSKSGRNPTPYSFVYTQTPMQDRSISTALVSKTELVADAWHPRPGHARVFPRDPASQPDPDPRWQPGPGRVHNRRPTRYEEDLEKFRCEEEITPRRRDPLEFPVPPPVVDPENLIVKPCPGFVLEDPPGTPAPKHVDLPDTGPDYPPILSNDFAAISAFKNVRQFFLRLAAYGIPPTHYFRIAKLPLKVFYRSGIRPGPGKDGQTVNARVLAEGFSVTFEGPTPPNKRPGLEMHLALGDLSTRGRRPWNGQQRSQAQPLGIAADARWIWHEIGHVLLMASVGELQFRFAHSAGDALAAIVLDPQSALNTDPNWRGATFPWVFLPRRHDRCVTHGWSWGGGLHYELAQVQDTLGPRRKGYWSEQILSSSLFRLYRCIGGDTTEVGAPDKPDIYERESASHYSVYLIMRGIQTLGTSIVVPANEPDQLVSALIDADINTSVWDVSFTPEYCEDDPPADTSFDFSRVGGCVHKVIRWAFEVQGLYGNSGSSPGNAPPVDIFIESMRPSTDPASGALDYGKGSYVPVSLAWDNNQTGADAPLLWQASRDAIEVVNGDIYVWVQNRGLYGAAGVTVRVWWHNWPNGSDAPDWNDGAWEELDPTLVPSQLVTMGGRVSFGPYTYKNVPDGRYILLASASCDDDLANTDGPTGLPCSYLATPLIDLVANDNNLGLRVMGKPRARSKRARRRR
jgi:hypothetical protein